MSHEYSEIKVIEGSSSLLRRVKCMAKQEFQQMDPLLLKKPELVLIDYDNTLVDSWPQDFETSNKVFEELGHEAMSVIEMLQQPHMSAVEAIAKKTNIAYEKVKAVYNKIYKEVHAELAPPLPEAENLLYFLKENKIPVIVVSNKGQDLLNSTVKKMGWNKYFIDYSGAQKDKPKKPNPSVVHEIVKKNNRFISYDSIFFVGDTLSNDLKCALEAGVIPVWMSDYSVDELAFGEQGPKILKANNCQNLIEIFKGCLKNNKKEIPPLNN